jgi:hypothetical protein
MPHARRVVLELDCGHLTAARGRSDGLRRIVGTYAQCPLCGDLRRVVDVRMHEHAVHANV